MQQRTVNMPTPQMIQDLKEAMEAKRAEKIKWAFCPGYGTCPSLSEVYGFDFALKDLVQSDIFGILSNSKDDKSEQDLFAGCADARLLKKIQPVNDWRKTDNNWVDANVSYQAVFSLDKFNNKGWSGYKEYFVGLGVWEKFLLPQFKLSMQKSGEVSDEELSKHFESIKKEITDAIDKDAKKFIANHENDEAEIKKEPDLEKRRAKLRKTSERYLKAEARDFLGMMRKLSEHDNSKPAIETLIIYKNDGNELSKLIRKYGWLFGYVGSTLQFYVWKFDKALGYIEDGQFKKLPSPPSLKRSHSPGKERPTSTSSEPINIAPRKNPSPTGSPPNRHSPTNAAQFETARDQDKAVQQHDEQLLTMLVGGIAKKVMDPQAATIFYRHYTTLASVNPEQTNDARSENSDTASTDSRKSSSSGNNSDTESNEESNNFQIKGKQRAGSDAVPRIAHQNVPAAAKPVSMRPVGMFQSAEQPPEDSISKPNSVIPVVPTQGASTTVAAMKQDEVSSSTLKR